MDRMFGRALVLLSMKPHVGFLVTAFIVFNSLRERRWKVPVALAGTFSGVVALTYLRFPELLGQWAQKGRLPTEWMGSSLPALLRSGLELSQGAGFALALGLSAIALISTILLSLRTAQPITTFVSPLLCLSCLLAPYGFVFDHCPLLLPLYAAFLAIWQHRQLRGLLNVLGPVALALLGAVTLMGVETICLMSFLPALVLVLWIYSERIRTGSVRHDSP